MQCLVSVIFIIEAQVSVKLRLNESLPKLEKVLPGKWDLLFKEEVHMVYRKECR